MSRNQRARRKDKYLKQQRARSLRPSKSAIWNEACDRADELMDQELWSQAREVLEAVDRLHPGANCVLDRLADVYEELGETDCLASVNSRRESNPLNEAMQQLIDIRGRFDSIDVDPEQGGRIGNNVGCGGRLVVADVVDRMLIRALQ